MVRVVSFVPGRPLLVAVESAGQARFVDFTDPARPTPGPVFAAGDALMIYDAGAVSPDGRTWARGTTDGTIELWDITGAPVLRATLRGHTGQLTSLQFAPKGAVLASGSADHSVRLWNLAQNTQYAVLSGSSLVRSTAYSPDATTLAVGDDEGTIGLWDVTDPTRPRTTPSLRGHTGSVEGLAFSADSRVLASASKDGPGEQDTVRLWNVLDGVRSAAVAVLPGWLPGQKPEAKETPKPLALEEALKKARVEGKYEMLLAQFKDEKGMDEHGAFKDLGMRSVTEHGTQKNLPRGHWVYVFPHYYIFRDLSATPKPNRDWGPEQAIGEPDTDQAGDIVTAWASRDPDGCRRTARDRRAAGRDQTSRIRGCTLPGTPSPPPGCRRSGRGRRSLRGRTLSSSRRHRLQDGMPHWS